MAAETTRPTIAVLAPDVAARIAAGEVIERPASVVKELVENALDAGARLIEVRLEGGGLDRIQVSDDGHGIPAEQLPLAFARHGTSKLRSDDDLERISTLGFRGEALPSIAAVAELRCQTRAADEPLGMTVRLVGDQIVERMPSARQVGTTITVDDLFAELPARRKFLRARATEAGLCSQVVAHLALARPDVAFRLQTDGRASFSTPGDGDLRAAALAVRGARFARGAFELGPADLVGSQGQRLARVYGLLGPLSEQRAGRAGLSLFVNGRWVQNRALAHAVEEAYRTVVRTGHHPVAIICLQVPPETVDVNVHPAKSEVRLLRESELYGWLHQQVATALPLTQQSWDDGSVDSDAQSGLGFNADGLRVLGQVGTTYIAAEGSLGLYLVDQHAAHERVLLEQLQAGADDQAVRQQLLSPEPVELPPAAGLEPEAVAAALVGLGFEAEAFGEQVVLIRSLPAVLAERQALAGLEQALDALADERPGPSWGERLALQLACKTAIKAGDSLPPEQMLALLQQLGEARLAETCAHGRPTSLLLSHTQLARQFGRS